MAHSLFSIKQKGDFDGLKKFLKGASEMDILLRRRLTRYGNLGVRLLEEATPKKSGKTAVQWDYEITKDRKGNLSLSFVNNAESKGIAVVVLLVYGHATRDGKWIEGRDFITPVADEIFRKIQNEIRREVNDFG